jgi:hypothetical protein
MRVPQMTYDVCVCGRSDDLTGFQATTGAVLPGGELRMDHVDVMIGSELAAQCFGKQNPIKPRRVLHVNPAFNRANTRRIEAYSGWISTYSQCICYII